MISKTESWSLGRFICCSRIRIGISISTAPWQCQSTEVLDPGNPTTSSSRLQKFHFQTFNSHFYKAEKKPSEPPAEAAPQPEKLTTLRLEFTTLFHLEPSGCLLMTQQSEKTNLQVPTIVQSSWRGPTETASLSSLSPQQQIFKI